MDTNGTNGWQDTTTGQQLQKQLNNEDVAKGFTHVLQRMGTLEKAVEKLTLLMERGPGMVSMVTDMVDDSVRQAAHRGVEVEQHLQAGAKMLERLTHPKMVQKLNNLMDLVDQAPGLTSMAVDMVDDGIRQAAERGVHMDERIKLGLEAAEKLTSPAMIAQLNQVIELSQQAPGMLAMMIDMADDEYRKAVTSGIDFTVLTEMAGTAGQALSNSRKSPAKKLGIWGLMRALNDDDRQKAMGFLMEFLKQFGNKL